MIQMQPVQVTIEMPLTMSAEDIPGLFYAADISGVQIDLVRVEEREPWMFDNAEYSVRLTADGAFSGPLFRFREFWRVAELIDLSTDFGGLIDEPV